MITKHILEKYSKEISPGGRILDIGCGEGNNALWLAKRGFEVTALDKDKNALNVLRQKILESKEKLKIKLEEQDIRNFEAPSYYYDAILAFNSLVFLKKSEFLNVIARIKKCLAVDGLFFISLFTEEDPSFSSFAKNKKPIEPDTFLNERTGEYWQFMKKGELKEVFSDFKTLFYEEKIVHDTRPTPHDHGIIFYVGKKKARNN